MSWVIPYKPTEFKWKDRNKFKLIDIRNPVDFSKMRIPFSINAQPEDLYTEELVELDSVQDYEDLVKDTEIKSPGAMILPIYNDMSFSCQDTPIELDAMTKPCRLSYAYFRASIITSTYDFEGKTPVIIGNLCEDAIPVALAIMRITNEPVIILRDGMLGWINAGYPVV